MELPLPFCSQPEEEVGVGDGRLERGKEPEFVEKLIHGASLLKAANLTSSDENIDMLIVEAGCHWHFGSLQFKMS